MVQCFSCSPDDVSLLNSNVNFKYIAFSNKGAFYVTWSEEPSLSHEGTGTQYPDDKLQSGCVLVPEWAHCVCLRPLKPTTVPKTTPLLDWRSMAYVVPSPGDIRSS